tara:strand:- start:1463 stop:1666 length:204 start_codon:yes stop_codon:yes gene_type:complete
LVIGGWGCPILTALRQTDSTKASETAHATTSSSSFDMSARGNPRGWPAGDQYPEWALLTGSLGKAMI